MPKWRILVVDDNKDVQKTTTFALEFITVLGKELELVNCSSASETEELLSRDTNFAVILLDVVMETQTAGLMLIQRIRETYGMTMTRIVLRTGQPGQAPEQNVIQRYEIDDYIGKESSTVHRLVTAVVTAIRAYDQLRRLSRMQTAMEKLLRLSSELMNTDSVPDFTAVAMRYVNSILGGDVAGIFTFAGPAKMDIPMPLAIVGLTNNIVDDAMEPDPMKISRDDVASVLDEMSHVRENRQSVKRFNERYEFMEAMGGRCGVLWLHRPLGFDSVDEQVIGSLINTLVVTGTRILMEQDRLQKAVISIGIVAHEFRTPIASMRMSVESILDSIEDGTVDTQSVKKKLVNVDNILGRMTHHIDLSQKNAGVVNKSHLRFAITRENLADVVRAVLEMHGNSFPAVEDMRIKLEPDCFAMIEKTTMEQVFINLMRNAMRAVYSRTEKPLGPKYEIVVSKSATEVHLLVTDFGTGIRPENMETIYTPFYSSSLTPTLGFGLTMVKKSVETMGGTVSCTSTYGERTTFDITLPRVE